MARAPTLAARLDPGPRWEQRAAAFPEDAPLSDCRGEAKLARMTTARYRIIAGEVFERASPGRYSNAHRRRAERRSVRDACSATRHRATMPRARPRRERPRARRAPLRGRAALPRGRCRRRGIATHRSSSRGPGSRRVGALAARAPQHERATHETPPPLPASTRRGSRMRRDAATAAVSVTPKIDVVWPVRSGGRRARFLMRLTSPQSASGSHAVPA
jgi:hypothetical protein